MAFSLLKLLSLATLALLSASLNGPLPASAVSIESPHIARHNAAAAHEGILARQLASEEAKREAEEEHLEARQNPGSKVGLAFAGRIDIAKFAKGSPKLRGVYNWCPYKDVNMVKKLPNNAQFYPMLWGHKQINQFKNSVKGNYAKTVFAFNEPNQKGQSNMSPGEAIKLWWQYLEPLGRQGYKLISPAPTNGPDGEAWLKQFVNGCKGCKIDGIATHFYGTDAERLIAHIKKYRETFKRQIWLTEFACQNFSGGAQCSKDQVRAFMKRTTQYMDQQSWVSLYCWFGSLLDDAMYNVNRANQLANGDSTPNALGRLYLGLDKW